MQQVLLFDFSESEKFGAQGECDIVRFLYLNPDIKVVVDVRDIDWARKTDIDFIVLTKRDAFYSVEVKTDSHDKTGNIFYEEFSNTEKQTEGCFEKTKAAFVFYYFPASKIVYSIRTQKFRQWYKANRDQFKVAPPIMNRGRKEGETYWSTGRLIPRRRLEANECKDFVKRFLLDENTV